jgi:hypothetical protein
MTSTKIQTNSNIQITNNKQMPAMLDDGQKINISANVGCFSYLAPDS